MSADKGASDGFHRLPPIGHGLLVTLAEGNWEVPLPDGRERGEQHRPRARRDDGLIKGVERLAGDGDQRELADLPLDELDVERGTRTGEGGEWGRARGDGDPPGRGGQMVGRDRAPAREVGRGRAQVAAEGV